VNATTSTTNTNSIGKYNKLLLILLQKVLAVPQLHIAATGNPSTSLDGQPTDQPQPHDTKHHSVNTGLC